MQDKQRAPAGSSSGRHRRRYDSTLPKALWAALLLAGCGFGGTPLRLLPENPHYFEYHGRPTILLTSGEHYGAVINANFDFPRYLATLESDHLNLTRIFSGAYREVPGNFDIEGNTLAPTAEQFVAPWARSRQSGAADGGNKFDLSKWNKAYFRRLKAFVREAALHGVIVEVNLFCPFYEDTMWEVSPMNGKNNINRIGHVKRMEVYTLHNKGLTELQMGLTRKIVSELQAFDNVYFEICNEPYFGGVTLAWQKQIAVAIGGAEKKNRVHLISQNIANFREKIREFVPEASVLNFHYVRPPITVAENYGLNRVIGNNETGFDGSRDDVYRIQAWDFLMAGGGLFNNLDYSFTADHENGTAPISAKTPGGGGVEYRKQLRILMDTFRGLPFARMHPANDEVHISVEGGRQPQALVLPGAVYAAYIHHATVRNEAPHVSVDNGPHHTEVTFRLQPGTYHLTWIEPKTGRELGSRMVQASADPVKILSPEYHEDVAVLVKK